MKNIALLGSTGSIGQQTLEIIDKNPDQFSIEVLTANNNVDLLIEQALKFKPNVVVISNEEKYARVKEALAPHPIKVYTGCDAIAQVVEMDSIDTVVTAMVGYSGLLPTIRAVKAGKQIALANKETLVVAGELVTRLAIEHRSEIIPIDSEHSAIFQCLVGEAEDSVEKILLTCSGGPFLGKTGEELGKVTPKQALKHPNWDMGAKITIDSATLMNKGFEVIEAKWLFGLKPDQVEVVVHPQSIIHSMVQFCDGSIKAQLGLPDMRIPIQFALSYPTRIKNSLPRFSFSDFPAFTFTTPDTKNFRNLALSFEALHKGGNLACVLNAANEVTVNAFLNEKISFLNIAEINEQVMEKIPFVGHPELADYIESDKVARIYTEEIILKQSK
ncbi:MAG: 1-deoxy-D-xylulose-5-phosphate reductoisomerase [Bacteroidetes bacterium]|nr:1-deoxy-D-xylulose-5-phosphate reductoisomerase [Bacteroidota bacterium]MCL6103079.1 1-deoxy-D-xylulose-5-phosphate reductoisomerase [Bacteroidota bacterium]